MTGECPQQLLGILLILLTTAQSTILFPAEFANQTASCLFHELHGTFATIGEQRHFQFFVLETLFLFFFSPFY